MSAKLKLVYFDGRGRAEISRLLLAASGVAYEDVRVKDWPALKPHTPYGQLPVLEVETEAGKVQIAQSFAIQRYVARKGNQLGSTPEEEGLIDAFSEAVREAITDFFAIRFAKSSEDEKKEKLTTYVKEQWVGKWGPLFEKHLAANSEGKEWVVGKNLSLADVVLSEATQTIEDFAPGTLTSTPLLAAHLARVHAVPAIANWIKTRPVTAY